MKLKKISTIVSLSLIMACSTAMAAPATDSQGHGTVTFKGAIIEAPCSIAADSVDQTVQLGQVSSAAL
ncbi:type 1 fimbrial protein, partial [Enterobacter bugandensis]|nr:type 1 fimbrial protein [Enterobacter bugandensis]